MENRLAKLRKNTPKIPKDSKPLRLQKLPSCHHTLSSDRLPPPAQDKTMLSRPLLLLILICTSFLLLASCTWPPANNQQAHKRVNGLAPLYGLQYENTIEDSYIVMFGRDSSSSSSSPSSSYSLDNHWAHLGQNLSHTDDFVKLGHGYGATVTDAALLERIRADANVLFVETDMEITLF